MARHLRSISSSHGTIIRCWSRHSPKSCALDGTSLREMRRKVPIIFTAHSVPERTIADGDPYESASSGNGGTGRRRAGFIADEDWRFAFQSQGMSGGPWLGPTVEETILGLKARATRGVFIQPIGFLCDHVEVLYDIDIAFKQFAAKQACGFGAPSRSTNLRCSRPPRGHSGLAAGGTRLARCEFLARRRVPS